jgi:hypothetical protein
MSVYSFVKKQNERCLKERLKANPDMVSKKQVLEIVNDFQKKIASNPYYELLINKLKEL